MLFSDEKIIEFKEQLYQEAADVLARVNNAYEKRTGKEASLQNWHAVSQASELRLKQAQISLGHPLPVDIGACYLACKGVLEMAGWRWLPIFDAQIKARLINTLQELRKTMLFGSRYQRMRIGQLIKKFVKHGGKKDGFLSRKPTVDCVLFCCVLIQCQALPGSGGKSLKSQTQAGALRHNWTMCDTLLRVGWSFFKN
jgi:hypothetical protein